MQQPFGHTLTFTLSRSGAWLSLGPGWAAIAGALSTGYADFNLMLLLRLVSLWLLVDPVLGTLWELSARQKLWHKVRQAQLPPAPAEGFYLPYAQPGTLAGRLVLQGRRYQLWWREIYWPQFGEQVVAFGLGLILALIIAVFLGPAIFGLVVLALGLIILTGQNPPGLKVAAGRRWQSAAQFLLPWLMGLFLWSGPTFLGLALAFCFWSVYLGGVRMVDHHPRAGLLFFMGQVGALLLLLAWRLLPGAALFSVLLVTQRLIKSACPCPAEFLSKAQPYLVLSLLVAALSVGTL